MGKIKVIRSGGQTGVDRGALLAARQLGVTITGWCPKGGLAEDFPNPPGLLDPYPELSETPYRNYERRTQLNVRDSDATLILLPHQISGSPGTEYTKELARRYKRPYLVLDQVDVDVTTEWLDELGENLDLNIAGPRERHFPGICDMSHTLVCGILTHYFPRLAHGKVVLASSSPRRLAIMRAHGIEPVVIEPVVDETLGPITSLVELEPAMRALALAKAQDVWNRLQQHELLGTGVSLIIAADTVVFKDRVLGKPSSAEEAFLMLDLLRNCTHQVLTGVAIIDAQTGIPQTFCDTSTVTFDNYTNQQIEKYLQDEPPYDKAGSYAIQGMWKTHVQKVEGNYENVVGLPWRRIEPFIMNTEGKPQIPIQLRQYLWL